MTSGGILPVISEVFYWGSIKISSKAIDLSMSVLTLKEPETIIADIANSVDLD